MLKKWRSQLAGWLIIMLLHITAHLPRRVATVLASWLGMLFERLMQRRRRIVEANLSACFPGWDAHRRRDLRHRLFQSLGLAVYEMALTWCRHDSRHLPKCEIDGMQHINQAVAAGRGVLLVNGHFNCLEITSRYLAEAMPLLGVYRPLDNPALERFHTRARLRYAQAMISKRNPREILRALRRGKIIWFAPDQDFGPQRSVFILFFGIPAATLTATWRLARSSGAAVLTAMPQRLPDGNYRITIGSELPGADADSPEIMLTALNRRIEDTVRQAPADYWWFHRRFKTTQDGARNIYSREMNN